MHFLFWGARGFHTFFPSQICNVCIMTNKTLISDGWNYEWMPFPGVQTLKHL